MNLLPAFVGAPEVNRVYHCDALTLLKAMPDASVDLIATDPPFNIGKASWDSWASLDSYLAWLDAHLREFRRVLKPNGSLYLFAATKYSARVELAVGAHFNVLSSIRWRKPFSRHNQADKETLRAFWDASESVIFAEQFGGDELASAEAGWDDAERQLKQRIWGDEIRRALTELNLSAHDLTGAIGAFGTVNHGGAVTNWLAGYNIPTSEQYQRMRAYLNNGHIEYLRREYEDLRREYEDLRREYEDLRRPFNATADAPYTDVWDFATVNTYPGKHICEKPLDMCQHIIRVSSRPDALVLDPFCGSGNMLRAAMLEGLRYIGGDTDLQWAERSRERLRQPFEKRQRATMTRFDDLPLFAMQE